MAGESFSIHMMLLSWSCGTPGPGGRHGQAGDLWGQIEKVKQLPVVHPVGLRPGPPPVIFEGDGYGAKRRMGGVHG